MNKKRLIISSLLIITILSISTVLYAEFYNTPKGALIENKEMYAVFLEDASGNYNLSTEPTWPTTHIFNTSKSYCKMGSTLSWDPVNSSILISSDGADECYVYFDLPSDINIVEFTLDNNPITSYPAKADNIGVDVTCQNGTGNWNYDDWNLEIDDFEGKPSCSINFKTVTLKNLDDYIVEDIYGGTDGEEGIYHTNNAEYRYTGLNPNNYIEFNDQMWRIIGVFNETSHGVSGQNLVKIISEESYTYAFDTAGDNSWSDAGGGATLNSLYNDYYYMGLDGTSYAGCRIYSTTIPADCDFRKNGLDSESRNMVQSATWYLGGRSTASDTTTSMYTYERGSTTSSGTNLSVQENIGLMYASDYGYAAPNTCWEANLISYNTASCGGANWLLKNQSEWTLVPYASSSHNVFYVYYDGSVFNFDANVGFASRPVLYLKSSVRYLSGTGSEADPFIIR